MKLILFGFGLVPLERRAEVVGATSAVALSYQRIRSAAHSPDPARGGILESALHFFVGNDA